MHRRITASFEFRSPNWLERRDIWRLHASNGCKLSAEIDWQEIALRYELAGGFIKNAMHSALLNAVSREGPENPVITQQDVEEGCALQMRGSLKMKAFRHRVVPTAGLEQLVLTETVLQQVSKKNPYENLRQGPWVVSSLSSNGTKQPHQYPLDAGGLRPSFSADACSFDDALASSCKP